MEVPIPKFKSKDHLRRIRILQKREERIRSEMRRDRDIQEDYAYETLKEKMDPEPEPESEPKEAKPPVVILIKKK